MDTTISMLSSSQVSCSFLRCSKTSENFHFSFLSFLSGKLCVRFKSLQSLTTQDAATFYQGPDPATATSTDWSDLNSLMGGTRRVGYNNIAAPAITISGAGLTISGSGLSISSV